MIEFTEEWYLIQKLFSTSKGFNDQVYQLPKHTKNRNHIYDKMDEMYSLKRKGNPNFVVESEQTGD